MIFENKIIESLSAIKNDQKSEGMKAYMKGHFEFLGVPSSERRVATRELIKQTKNRSNEELWSITGRLWSRSEREYQYVAMDIWAKNFKKLKPNDIKYIEKLILNKSWWDTVDWLASHMVGQLFKSYPDMIEMTTKRWIKSDNIWLNRTCILYQLFYNSETDVDRLRYYIENVKLKKDFFIQKAIGWSLRQQSKFDSQMVVKLVEELNLSGLAKREALRLIPIK